MIRFFSRKKESGQKNNKDFIIQQQKDFDKKLVLTLSKSRFPTPSQLKYLPKYLSKREKWTLAGLALLCLASVIFLGIRLVYLRMDVVPAYSGEYAEGLVGEPQYINPILAQTNDVDMDISRLVFSGLFRYNEQMEFTPELAERYEISEDKKVYTVYLKDNLRWHDGEPLTASDVIFTVTSIQDPSYKSPLYSSFRGVTIEEVDSKTVRFTLGEAYAPFLGMLTFGILPEHTWSEIPAQSANLAEYNIKPVGSGPFQFKSLTKDKNGNIKSYTLVRNENFYGKKPFLDKVIFKFYADFPALLDALRNKNIEGIGFLPEEYRDSLQSGQVKEYLLDMPQYTAIFFNQKSSEVLKDAAVRQALAKSLDKNELVEEVFGSDAEVIDSPILPGFVGYSENIKTNSFDAAAAKALLDNDGYKFVDGIVRKKDDQTLKITLTTVDRPDYIKAAEKIKTAWEGLGVQVDLQTVAAARLQREVIRPRAFEALMASTIVGFDPDPFPFWHSSQAEDPGLNLAQYANRKADKLIEDARQTDDAGKRSEAYIEFQNILTEDVPAIFLYSPRYAYFVGEEIKGMNLSRISIPSDRFAGITNWYKKTKRQSK